MKRLKNWLIEKATKAKENLKMLGWLLGNKFRLYAYLWWLTSKHKFTLKYILEAFWGWLRPYFTPRMIPIVLSLWLMTNGIWYIIGFVPFSFIPDWLSSAARWYIGFLYSPIALEKLLILYLAKVIYKALYKDTFIPIYKAKLIKRLCYDKYINIKEVTYESCN